VVVVATVLSLAWVGFIGSDDMEYYLSGRALSGSFWNAAGGFGGMRASVTMPIAFSLRIFGDREWALVLPTVGYALATAAVSVYALARVVPIAVAWLTTVLFWSLPAVAITATMASADVAELFWAVCAFWLVMEACASEGGRQTRLLVAAGACVGLAFAARETAVALIIWLGAGFLLGLRLPRVKYLWTAAGFLCVVVLECMYYAISVGNPLARFTALVGTRSVTSRMVVPPFTFDDTGNLRIHDAVDPLVMLLTKHSFGVLYWSLLLLALFIWFRRRARDRQPVPTERSHAVNPALPALALALIWGVFASVVLLKMRIHARYYLTPTYFLMVAAALWWFAHIGTVNKRATALAATAVLFLANALGIWLDNRNPRFAERALAAMALRYDEPIHTDVATAGVARVFLSWNGGQAGRIVDTPPAAGDLAFRVLTGVGAENRQRGAHSLDLGNIEVVDRRAAEPLLSGSLITQIVAAGMVPGPIARKLTASRSSAELIRIGPDALNDARSP
jgi:hypothetical protein